MEDENEEELVEKLKWEIELVEKLECEIEMEKGR